MKRNIPLVIGVTALFFILLNWYVISGIRVVVSSPLAVYCFLGAILLILISLSFSLVQIGKTGMTGVSKTVAHAFLLTLVGQLVFVSVLLPMDIFRVLTAAFTFVSQGKSFIPERSVHLTEFAIALSGLSCVLFVYGILRGKYAYRVIKHELFYNDLPTAFDGFKIVQISDIHAGSFGNKKSVQKGVDLIKAQQADLLVFTGDLVNNKASEILPWIDVFSQIRAPFGQFSILGNHDYGDYVRWPDTIAKQRNLQALKQYHAKLGYQLLLDEHVVIRKGSDEVILAGVENWGLGFGERGDLKKAINGVNDNAFKILLSHDPTHWETIVKKHPSKVHLTLSGHTHGMQVGLEALGIKWSPVKYRYPHWAGIANFNGRYLNINRGFGFLGFSGRVGIWPEITLITLRKKQENSEITSAV
ncbi:metallophosphoesterase [Arcticibacter sp.]|uniref:metallophosphoesterase n=1 Tax=Arcticibacter sp. TaxID=1872630 RepID=UPI003890CDE1